MFKSTVIFGELLSFALAISASAQSTGTYFNDFSDDDGIHHGSSFITTYMGHADLQLVSDGQPGTWGTWQSGGFEHQRVTSFETTFKFSFKNDGGPADGFSFLFGDMSDMSGDNAQGGEWGLNAFHDSGTGMSIGFDSYDDSGIYARWGNSTLSWLNFGSEWYSLATYTDYNQALDDFYQGTIQINWDITTGLDVGVSWPGHPMYWLIDTSYFSSIDTTNFTFGFAARNGGIDMDVLVDNLNIAYTYEDLDIDGDGIPNDIDNCPSHSNPDQADCDLDGFGDVCEIADGTQEDSDGNGIPDDCEEQPCVGDCNGDGVVDVNDLLMVLDQYANCTGECSGDLDGSGAVDIDDILALLSNWGDCP